MWVVYFVYVHMYVCIYYVYYIFYIYNYVYVLYMLVLLSVPTCVFVAYNFIASLTSLCRCTYNYIDPSHAAANACSHVTATE